MAVWVARPADTRTRSAHSRIDECSTAAAYSFSEVLPIFYYKADRAGWSDPHEPNAF